MGGFYTSSLDRLLSVTLSLTTALPQGEKSQSIKSFKWLYKKKNVYLKWIWWGRTRLTGLGDEVSLSLSKHKEQGHKSSVFPSIKLNFCACGG